MLQIGGPKSFPDEDLLSAMKRQLASDKERVRRLLLEMREREESGPPTGKSTLLGSGSLSPDSTDDLAPHEEEGAPPPSISLMPPAELIISESVEDKDEEKDDDITGKDVSGYMLADDDDDFDMFQIHDEHHQGKPKKRLRVTTGGAKKRKAVALAAELRPSDCYDDAEGYYRPHIGELLESRYRILSGLFGKGMFSSVIRCLDTQTDVEVAIKVVRANALTREAGLRELSVLTDLKGNEHVIKCLGHFEHRGHLCLVFESMSADLRTALKRRGQYEGLGLDQIESYARQMMSALKFLKEMEVVHADVKPDNILVSADMSKIKLCDFGSAYRISELELNSLVVSRFYRAPEIILGTKWSYGVDMWAMCCSLYELAVGTFLFTGSSNHEMLEQFMQLRGRFPNKVLKAGEFTAQYFTPDMFDFITKKGETVTVAHKPSKLISDLLNEKLVGLKEPNVPQGLRAKVKQFADFLDKGLIIDSARRMTPEEALDHPFLREQENVSDIATALNLEFG